MKNIAKRVAAGLAAALLLATTDCAAGGSSKQQDFQPSLDTEKKSSSTYWGILKILKRSTR